MFIRDPKALWYHGGCDGLGSTVEDLAKSLTELVRLSESERVIFMGASAGGYAAILFSCLVPAHRVLAFAPQTFLEPEQRAAVGDARWPEMTKRASSWLDRRYTDLRPIVEASAGLEIAVHYSARNRLDVIHAEHLGGVRPIDFVCHPEEAHSLPKILKDQGRLEAIIEKSILA
jgi:acetyl esterase/lipase